MRKQLLLFVLLWTAWALWRGAQTRPFHVLIGGKSHRVSRNAQGLCTLAGLARKELVARDLCLENLLNIDNCCRPGVQPYRRKLDSGDCKWVYQPSHPFAVAEGSHKGYLPLPNLSPDRELLELAGHEQLYREYRRALRQLEGLCPDFAVVEPVSQRGLELALQCRSRFALQQDSHRYNLANHQTTAYRCRTLFFEGIQVRTLIHQAQGALKPTGRALDFALDDNGKGYFVVQSGEGLEYTRDGHFRRSGSGHLVTFDGALVLGALGPIKVPISGRLRIARCQDPTRLEPLQNGRFLGDMRDTEDFRLCQGYLEQSNVNPQLEELELRQFTTLLDAVKLVKLIPD